MTAEEWRPALGFPDYRVSSLGRIRSHRRCVNPEGRLLAGWVHGNGYRHVFVFDAAGRRIDKDVHVLVAEAFHGPRPEGMDVRHLDGDKTNNAASNLRYGTRSENLLDAVEHGTHFNARKTHCPARHPYSPENTYVAPTGERDCRTCRRDRRIAAQLASAGIKAA